jgi:hypothetical protein
MTRQYDGNHELDIGYFERIEGSTVGKPVAIFHKIPEGYPLTPKDPEVKLTRDELSTRISWRKSAGLDIEEEEKAKAALEQGGDSTPSRALSGRAGA